MRPLNVNSNNQPNMLKKGSPFIDASNNTRIQEQNRQNTLTCKNISKNSNPKTKDRKTFKEKKNKRITPSKARRTKKE